MVVVLREVEVMCPVVENSFEVVVLMVMMNLMEVVQLVKVGSQNLLVGMKTFCYLMKNFRPKVICVETHLKRMPETPPPPNCSSQD